MGYQTEQDCSAVGATVKLYARRGDDAEHIAERRMSMREEIQPRPRRLDLRHLHCDARTWRTIKRDLDREGQLAIKKSKNVGEGRRVGTKENG